MSLTRFLLAFALLPFLPVIARINGAARNWSVGKCLKYMKKKYGCRFEFSRPHYPLSTSRGVLDIFVKTDKYPGRDIFVRQICDENPHIILDNLVAVKYEEQTAECITQIAHEVFGECKAIYQVNDRLVLPPTFDDAMTLSEFLASWDANLLAFVVLPPNHSDENVEDELHRLFDVLKARNVACNFMTFYAVDDEQYQSMKCKVDVSQNMYQFKAKGRLEMGEKFEIKFLKQW